MHIKLTVHHLLWPLLLFSLLLCGRQGATGKLKSGLRPPSLQCERRLLTALLSESEAKWRHGWGRAGSLHRARKSSRARIGRQDEDKGPMPGMWHSRKDSSQARTPDLSSVPRPGDTQMLSQCWGQKQPEPRAQWPPNIVYLVNFRPIRNCVSNTK